MQHRQPQYLGINPQELNFRKRQAPKGREETDRERVERELSNLMEDRRYWDGDPDYRAHVRRQFQRVYDSPDNPPQGFRIGPPDIHATTVEPYRARSTTDTVSVSTGAGRTLRESAPDRSREQRRTLLSKPASSAHLHNQQGNKPELITGGRPDRARASFKTVLQTLGGARPRQSEHALDDEEAVNPDKVELFDPSDDELEEMQTYAVLRSARQSARAALDAFDASGADTASSLLRHYLDGTGAPVTIPSGLVRDFGGVQDAEENVVRYFEEWLRGDLNDTRFGMPTLNIRDGERIETGGGVDSPASELARRVRWEKTFAGAGESGNLHEMFEEAQWAVGGGMVVGYGSFVLERHGDQIALSGFIDFRVEDEYDFSDEHPLGFDKLASLGTAEVFKVYSSTWRRRVDALIPLVNGRPQPFDLHLSEE